MEKPSDWLRDQVHGIGTFFNEDAVRLYCQGDVPSMGSDYNASSDLEPLTEKRALNGNIKRIGPRLYSLSYMGEDVKFFFPNHEDHIQRLIKERGTFYEQEMLEDIRQRLKPGSNVIDIGAYIGTHSIYFGKFCGANVLAIEPSPDSYKILRENVKLNNLEDKVTCVSLAIGDKIGKADCIPPKRTNQGENRVIETSDGQIPLQTLDNIITAHVDMIKIDIEGMEEKALLGAEKTIREYRPLLYVEITDESTLSRIDGYLSSFGYKRKAVYNATPTYLYSL